MVEIKGIKEMTAEAAGLLRRMVSVPSPSYGEEAVCSLLCSYLRDKDIPFERIGNNIVAEHIVDGTKPTLMLCAHIDTVSPAAGYGFDPYGADSSEAMKVVSDMTEKIITDPDEIVAGLGSNDDGASCVSIIQTFLYTVNNKIKTNLTLALTCEEEKSGKDGMTSLWDMRLNRISHAIVGEPTGMKAAVSERGLLVIDAEAVGESGHAARNEGVNSIYIAMEDIARIRGHKFTRPSRMGDISLNVTQICAGTAHNVIPDRCSFVIDIRPNESYSNAEILKELQGICRSTLKARNLSNRSSATAEGAVLTGICHRTGTETFRSPTTSDWMRIGCDAIKMGPGDSSRSHRKNEFVFVEEIKKGIEKYIEFVIEYGKEFNTME
ncbi:MAG: M20/M25/M40 family metallo-hydrolase [Candidatus Cryptobacteroides sp.]